MGNAMCNALHRISSRSLLPVSYKSEITRIAANLLHKSSLGGIDKNRDIST